MKGISKVLLPIFTLVLLVAPAMAAHITHFNGLEADIEDQVDTIRLAVGQSGNVTVIFDEGYTLDSTNTTLVINFSAANISSYNYSASGDTTNLTVTRNPTNLTFTYNGTSTVTISVVNLTFNFSRGLSASEGINTRNDFLEPKVLAYVSEYITSRTVSNTTEKIMYLVYDPFETYVGSFALTAPENATISVSDNTVELNFTNATTNEANLKVTINRGNYTDTLVPIQKGYIVVKLNNTYVTGVVTLSTVNLTEVGAYEEDGYTTVKYIDRATNYTKEAVITGSFWDTNNTEIEDGLVLSYNIDPIGGIATTVDDDYNLTITAVAIGLPPEAMWYVIWQYEFLGIPILAWFGIITAIAFFILVIWRVRRGMRAIPESAAAQGIVIGIWTYLFALATLQDWWRTAFEWVANNPVPAVIIFALIFVLLLLGMAQLMTTRE